MSKRVVASVLLMAALLSSEPSWARSPRHAPTFGVSSMCTVPSPGHPLGLTVHNGRIVVSTSGGQPLPWMVNTIGERIFTMDSSCHIEKTFSVTEGPASNMGLAGVKFDGLGRLYAADMNGFVRRYSPAGVEETWQQLPVPYCRLWTNSMLADVVFDAAGNTYLTDGAGGAPNMVGRIWRATPDGAMSVWFSDRRLVGSSGFQEQVSADGQWLYFASVLDANPDKFFYGHVYRLRIVDHPESGDLEEVYELPRTAADLQPDRLLARGPYCCAEPNGLVIGRSGNIYVTVSSRDQVIVLDPKGHLLRTITSPLFHWPQYLAFMGDRLLVTNLDERLQATPEASAVLSIDVGDTGIREFAPTNIR